MNIFQLNYEQRLKHWHQLRIDLENSDTKTKCIEIDKFWQAVPLVNHYLHTDYIHEWPDPWELISDNEYCVYSRSLGMIYTLMLLGINDIDFVDAKDDNNEDVVLVLVDNKFVLNYWPNTVSSNKISDFTVKRSLSIDLIKNKIK